METVVSIKLRTLTQMRSIIILDAFDTKGPLRPLAKLGRESLVEPPPLLALSLKQPYFSVLGGERSHKRGK